MFDSLTGRLGEIFDGLKKRGALSESDVSCALREVRIALLEADVALPVVKDFISGVRDRARGQEVLRSVTPGQMVIKIVHDHLVETLGGDAEKDQEIAKSAGVDLAGTPPVSVLMVGLQGSGKTTSCAKLATLVKKREKKRVLMASLDIYRPAAQQQLAILGEQSDTAVLPVVAGELPADIAKRAMETGRREGYDVVILDTAGRLHVDETMMAEAAAVKSVANPVETLLVADAMTGQDAVTLADSFHQQVGLTGIVLTRVDGDARGGAALSMRAVTGKPIKLMGVGEKLDEMEPFQATRVAGRILGMGDVVGLVERAADVIDQQDAEKLARKISKGEFSLEDMLDQFKQLRKMGDVKGLLGMLPGVGKIKQQLEGANIDNSILAKQEAIILSMTLAERRNPKILNGSRRRRIATGSGSTVQDVNRLLKQHRQMGTMMKKMGKMGRKGMMSGRGLPPELLSQIPPMKQGPFG